jgi:hypothetical protein
MEEPQAESGYLCVYGGGQFSEFLAIRLLSPGGTENGASRTGARLIFTVEGEEAKAEGIQVTGGGSFAVTG